MMSMTKTARLSIGDRAPLFSLPNDHGGTTSLSDYAGKRVLVYFYPRAHTPGCTKEACDFRDSLAQFNNLGIEVLGVSPDSVEKLVSFKEKEELNFTLLSNEAKDVMVAYGAFGEKKNYGKIVQGVIRSTFIIEPDGTIGLALYNVRATGHVARVIKELI
ncbi:Bacterioferritin comigratory protein [Corynebacterium kutscheri]|nr:Bacterioferritin comigratory protein [Corynebacterium kutscheri]